MTDEEAAAVALANEELVKAYRLAFSSPAGQAVLMDLTKFCRANGESCGVPGNTDLTFMLLGRHEVFQRIQKFSKMTADQLAKINAGIQFNPAEEETDG